MAALLVMLAVMSVLMAAALPAWRFQAKREKELELIFRGQQYMRAIGLFERRMGPGSRPPTIDVLVQQRFLRKKYKDPMTPDGEFQPLYFGANIPGATPPTGRGGPGGRGGMQQPPGPSPSGVGPGSTGGQFGAGGIIGVVSKSKEASIRVYNGSTRYNEWRFLYAGQNNRPGGGDGRGGPGQARPGMPGTGPAGRGGRGGRGTPGMLPDGQFPGRQFPGRGQPPGGRGGPGTIIRGPGQ